MAKVYYIRHIASGEYMTGKPLCTRVSIDKARAFEKLGAARNSIRQVEYGTRFDRKTGRYSYPLVSEYEVVEFELDLPTAKVV